MALLGKAALAMWWDMAAPAREDFEHWHAHEHFPERLGIPGFRRASRWRSADGGAGVFVLYELEDHGVLSSAAYLARLNAPTAWSTRLMPEHREMVRSQCRVLESRGGSMAGHALAVRLSPAPGHEDRLRSALRGLAAEACVQPGLAGLHLLRHETPDIAQTAEQKLRGLNDRYADWVLLACGYDAVALAALSDGPLADARLTALGAAPGTQRNLYQLAYSALPGDVADAVL
ncbi:hypothetical protein [Pseudorhodoferax sp. Leaf274]|uniref:hypothetical protein n=1 Tax=Pseudorhodoferax sp. Leaf274 TaxID=1736318 RepID=UPI0007037030|nr:hypothetical protein [Pseudorhodoferax sp. Leaf274]KQP37607.1 hypothetical protein ASF44_14165 [Pseudorhodoferax sp. Leaf274]